MSSPLPEHAAPDGQRAANPLTESMIHLAVEDVVKQTSYRDDSPLPEVGDAPPAPQPGRPAMSSKATDASVRMLSFGLGSLMAGGGVSIALLASGVANPTVVGLICAAPPATLLALSRLTRSAGRAAPQETHNHYTGDVYQDQRTVHTSTRGVWAKTNNKPN